MEGQIIKALSGFYYVFHEGKVYQTRARGNFRKRKMTPLVGDDVVFQAENDTDGYILDILPRENELIRPPVANIDIAILVFSAVEPDFSTNLTDRFLVAIEKEDIRPVIGISKMDLATEEEKRAIEKYRDIYENAGYEVFLTGSEVDKTAILELIDGKTAVIAGQSGVGKSTFLNQLNPDLTLKTGEISTSLGRGRHTTRHVELLPIGDGLIADTPGFSSIEWDGLEPENLQFCFPEIEDRRSGCKFRGCLHENEPSCAVKTAVAEHEIADFRYEHYVQILAEIKNRKPRYS
ncbi:ribosome small subunit-dependent GTPase A [Listeria fleischmannii]|uniref:Small ribosomal subunit biogenesis GTPase RsgA n=2 Tax=Listeria fleischmannii TaxID=1069827 RepID=A0A841YH87_9LIST|nr:ribosome small subunit-dependent GTPase A [Listeria fleischmannii]MBC1399504.1 ribosome small subunit-dependent GTPase A [Listeria fleischmannii]MBC1428232.1 ribosome small subunit-dependent GTPase A [Listeria fleischmannii]